MTDFVVKMVDLMLKMMSCGKDFTSDWSDYTGECTKDPDGYQHKCCETGKEDVCEVAQTLPKEAIDPWIY